MQVMEQDARMEGCGVDDRLAWASAVHDGPLQLLVAALKELDDTGEEAQSRGRQLVADAVAGLRDVLGGSDRLLSGWELEGRLEDWCEHLRGQRSADFSVAVVVDRPVARLVHDAARELLTNAARHSGAAHVSAHVESDPVQGITVRVIDDGRGMPVRVRDGYGLQILRRRVELAGGALHHRRLMAGGTLAEARLPAATHALPLRSGAGSAQS